VCRHDYSGEVLHLWQGVFNEVVIAAYRAEQAYSHGYDMLFDMTRCLDVRSLWPAIQIELV